MRINKKFQHIESAVCTLLGSVRISLIVDVKPGNRSGEAIVHVSHDSAALRWNYKCLLDYRTKQVTRESVSWSGLNDTTVANLTDLEESAKVIELLCNADWAFMLDE